MAPAPSYIQAVGRYVLLSYTKMGCGGKISCLLLMFWGQFLSKWLLLIKYDIETVLDIDQLIFFYCLVENPLRCLFILLFFSSYTWVGMLAYLRF